MTSLFLTGKAWTGKSTLINHFIETTKKNILVLAPTWVAAVNIWWTTIHSFFGLHPGITLEEVIDGDYGMNALKWKILHNLDTIVIDEISMVRSDMMHMLHLILQDVYWNEEAFWWKQMILVWDLYQLPPIVRGIEKKFINEHYWHQYFFAPECYDSLKTTTIALEHIYRQEEAEFRDILNKIRLGLQSQEELNILNKQVWSIDSNSKAIYLMTTNADAALINTQKLRTLSTQECRSFSEIEGDVPKSMYMNSNELVFKEWAQVMMLVNGKEYRNGTIGTILEWDSEQEIAIIDIQWKHVEIEPHTWNIRKPVYIEKQKRIENEVVGSYTQLPFKLARAITIHKSQWLTFDNVIIDFGNRVFANWQAYVALSRATNLSWLTLVRPLAMRDITCDSVVREWMMDQTINAREQIIQDAILTQQQLRCRYQNYRNNIEDIVGTPQESKEIIKSWIDFNWITIVDQHGKERVLNRERMFEIELMWLS